MEEDSPPSVPSKRQHSIDEASETSPAKKVRLSFTPKEFRKLIKTEQKTQVLQQFLEQILEEKNQNFIQTYLENGGSALELLQTMEGELGAPPILVFDIVNRVLLEINARLPKYRNAANDVCRYLVSSYLTQLNKMLGLSSSMKERVVALKLLTTIVTFSVVLAKDVLLQVNFNPTNLELITKVEKNEARGVFIHFVTAFLVGGHFSTLSALLEKKGFFTSIIKGLQYDKADTVILILTAMKDHILENTSISKTFKMKIFHTGVVKDIVNLYNWKGPAGLIDPKKKTKVVPVDEIGKSKINEAVHSFLLVLCTSHKFGVIFKTTLEGLTKKQNPLMLTVLESLERPWEHSYAGELVLRICQVCPDLGKIMWFNLKPFLEPRWTTKWLKSVDFAGRLLDEFQLDFIEPNINTHQLNQVIAVVTGPLSTLRLLIPENGEFDKPSTKHRVMTLFLKMAQRLENFNKTWKNFDLSNRVERNFPALSLILNNWNAADEVGDYLEVAFDLLEKYKVLAPRMLDEWNLSFDLKNFLETVESVDETRRIQVKVIRFFLDLEPGLFKSKTDLFKNAILLTMESYYLTKNTHSFEVLKQLVTNCGIFDGFVHEIDFWIDGILNLKSYDDEVPRFFCDLIEKSEDNAAEYHHKLFELKDANFSISILSLREFFGEADPSKSLKNYLNFVLLNIFHSQINSAAFVEIATSFHFLSDGLKTYFSSWSNLEVAVLNKCKGKLIEQFQVFSKSFLESNIENFAFDFYPNQKLNFLQSLVFYLTNLVKVDALRENHKNNCLKFLDYLISESAFDDERYVGAILNNPTLLQNFNIFNSDDFLTKFVLIVAKNINQADYLTDYRKKVVAILSRVFRKFEKYQNSIVSIDILETLCLDYFDCKKLLIKFVSNSDNKMFHAVSCYCLNRITQLSLSFQQEPLDPDIIEKVSVLLRLMIKDNTANINFLSMSLNNYLHVFPHCVGYVDSALFSSLICLQEFHKDNLNLCEFLLSRNPLCWDIFEQNLAEICSKRSLVLTFLDLIVGHYTNNDSMLEKIFTHIEPHIAKALQKPQKAGQHFQNRYKSVGFFIEKFMKPEGFGTQIQKFETVEYFHVYLLKKAFAKVEKTDKTLSNMIMTFVHLLVSLIKQKKEVNSTAEIVLDFLRESPHDLSALNNNETLKMFSKLCLKHGIGGDLILIKILAELVDFFDETNGKLILDMMFSHSQFLDVALEDSPVALFCLWQKLCTKWPQFMERNHIPVLLSAYTATKKESSTLTLLSMYESKSTQTKFFDFKPFLWGRAAASHYSVRSEIVKTLWRQPKAFDILNNLHFGTIVATVTNPEDENSYDLDFFLPLFSHLLAPENPVPAHKFTRSGALALALTGLRGEKTHRLAACHVLQRFYFHLEAKQNRDNLIWLRLIEGISKGIVNSDDFKINNFVGVFLARMALILANPTEGMFVPLSQYLAAKNTLDFGTIPELYTFLHSPHVESKQHKHFILEVIRDGLKSEKDFAVFLKSMGFKLVSELFSSVVCDSDSKILILEIFEKCVELDLGVKVLCGSASFISQVFSLVIKNLNDGAILSKLIRILLRIVEFDTNRHRNFLVYFNLIIIGEAEQIFHCLHDSHTLDSYYRSLMIIVNRFPDFFTREHMENLVKKSEDKFCEYLRKYGCKFVKEQDCASEKERMCLRLLLFNKLN